VAEDVWQSSFYQCTGLLVDIGGVCMLVIFSKPLRFEVFMAGWQRRAFSAGRWRKANASSRELSLKAKSDQIA
jgi:hypothetical protein